MGRHARALSARGYSVIGVERDADVIAKARALGTGPTYENVDIRDYRQAPGAFDVVIIMSQSFGYFDAAKNLNVLRQLATGVREGGRVILDLWNADFFVAHDGERDLPGNGGIVRESKHVENGRLFVYLHYPDGAEEAFEWQLFSPEQMDLMANSVGLRRLVMCADFDEKSLPYPVTPSVQFVFERSHTPESPNYLGHALEVSCNS